MTRRGFFGRVGAAFAGFAAIATMGKKALAKCVPEKLFRESVGVTPDGKFEIFLWTRTPIQWNIPDIDVPDSYRFRHGTKELQVKAHVPDIVKIERVPYTRYALLSENERFLQEMYDRRWEGGRGSGSKQET